MSKTLGLIVWRGLIVPVGSVLVLPLLLIAMLIFGIAVFVLQCWEDAHA